MKLKLADGLALPLDVVTQKLAWLGVTGSGKTYGASKLAELVWHAGGQILVLDPVGVWYGIRLAKDGKKPSLVTIPIFGGLHGDVPLEPTGGALLANLVVDKALSVIIDVSQFESDTDKARFARDFADRFFFRKKAAPSAVHLFLEECQEFVPQNPQKGEERMLHAFIRMQKLGRNFGIGSSYLSQRPQEVNKKALNMAQTLFVFRTTGTHERKAIESWIADKALDQDIAGDLPKIPTGDCHVWSPEFLKISETVHILEKETFNASATPEVGAAAKARELAPIDLDQVRAEMAATIEKAKADDPRELRKQIAELKKSLDGIKNIPDRKPEVSPKVVERFVLKDGQLARAEKLIERIAGVSQAAADLIERFHNFRAGVAAAAEEIAAAIAKTQQPRQSPTPTAVAAPRSPQARRSDPRPVTPRPARLVSDSPDVGTLGKGERKVLTAIAQYSAGVSREQLTILTGYKRSSRDTYLQRLGASGFVSSNGSGTIHATDAGIEMLGDFEALPTGDELREYWLDRLPEGERKILAALAAAYPDGITRDDLSDLTHYKRSSRDTYLQRLSARKLIVIDRGDVRVSEELFT
jgi:hypothetical protein